MNWIAWTPKSEHVPFGTHSKGVGVGEEKTATELNTRVLGQNSPYDMKISVHGSEYQCDVKKLDKNTFNTGVKGRNALRPIKHKISDFLNILRKIRDSPTFTQADLLQFDAVSPDELCVMLHKKREQLVSSLPIVSAFTPTKGEPTEISLDKYYRMCLIFETPLPSEYLCHMDTLTLLTEMSHEYIVEPKRFRASLDELVTIFTGLKLIFVDEDKGYCIWDNLDMIKFERITRGHPRFRVCV
jgi:hypothetical protein